MVKSETRRDAEILVRNPSPRLLGKKFQDSKTVKTNHAKTRLRDLSKSRSCQNFPRPTFFVVPFATPTSHIEVFVLKLLNILCIPMLLNIKLDRGLLMNVRVLKAETFLDLLCF